MSKPGAFQKGPDARRNAGGRTKESRDREKRLSEAVRRLGGEDGEKYVLILDTIASSADEQTKDRIVALKELLDRGYGKAPDFLQVDGVGLDPHTQAMLDALRMTPHERRAAQDSTAAEDDAAMAELENAAD